MISQIIPILVDAETAIAFDNLPVEEKNKLQVFLSWQIKTALKSEQSLLEIMDEISAEAEAKGLTPEILESLLEDE
jgi:hypothetical protein